MNDVNLVPTEYESPGSENPENDKETDQNDGEYDAVSWKLYNDLKATSSENGVDYSAFFTPLYNFYEAAVFDKTLWDLQKLTSYLELKCSGPRNTGTSLAFLPGWANAEEGIINDNTIWLRTKILRTDLQGLLDSELEYAAQVTSCDDSATALYALLQELPASGYDQVALAALLPSVQAVDQAASLFVARPDLEALKHHLNAKHADFEGGAESGMCYVPGFYLDDGEKWVITDSQLQNEAEAVSSILERLLPHGDAQEVRKEVIEYMDAIHALWSALSEHSMEGTDILTLLPVLSDFVSAAQVAQKLAQVQRYPIVGSQSRNPDLTSEQEQEQEQRHTDTDPHDWVATRFLDKTGRFLPCQYTALSRVPLHPVGQSSFEHKGSQGQQSQFDYKPTLSTRSPIPSSTSAGAERRDSIGSFRASTPSYIITTTAGMACVFKYSRSMQSMMCDPWTFSRSVQTPNT